jgi:hypothetical protein
VFGWFKSEHRQAMEEFRDQSHDWITVQTFTKATEAELSRQKSFRQLKALGFVEQISSPDWLSNGDAINEPDGRVLTKETTYRITANGATYAAPLFKRWVRNILANTPTILISVITAVIIAFVLDLMGPTKSGPPKIESAAPATE